MSTLVTSNISDGTTSVGTGYVVNGSAKAWCEATYSGGSPTNTNSLNVSSLTDVSVGGIGYNLSSAMASNNISQSASAQFAGLTGTCFNMVERTGRTTTYVLQNHYQNAAQADPNSMHMAVHGDLA